MFRLNQIESIKPCGIHTVYDITVEDDHSYIANDFVCHNSSKNPNLQNIPREAKIKGIITASPGYYLTSIDFSQVELRVMAFLSQDPVLLKVYKEGGDLHLTTACFLFKKKPHEITKWERKRAKLVNFGFIYGSTAKSALAKIKEKSGPDDDIPTLEEMQYFRTEFFKLYRGVDQYIKKVHRFIQQNGYVENIFGRVRRLPQILSPDEDKQHEALREGLNALVQSVASDITQMGSIKAHKFLRKKKVKSHFLLSVHDELLFEFHQDEINLIGEIKKLMEDVPPPFNLPLISEPEIFLKRWGWDNIEYNLYPKTLDYRLKILREKQIKETT